MLRDIDKLTSALAEKPTLDVTELELLEALREFRKVASLHQKNLADLPDHKAWSTGRPPHCCPACGRPF